MVLGSVGPATSPAAAAPEFPVQLSTLTAPGVVSGQDPASVIATNRNGDAVVAWKVFTHGPAKLWDFTSEVQVAFRKGADAPGVWSPAYRLTAPGWRATPDWQAGASPLVGIDDAGNATIAWSEIPIENKWAEKNRLRVVSHGPGGFSAVQEIVPESPISNSGGWDRPAGLAVAPDGQALLVYASPDDGTIVSQRRTAREGAFGPRVPLPGDKKWAYNVDLVMNSDGAAAVALDRGDVIEVARAPAGKDFGGLTEVARVDFAASQTSIGRSDIALDRSGAVTVAWVEVGPAIEPKQEWALRGPFQINARRVDPQATLGPVQRLATIADADNEAQVLADVALGVDDSGRVTAAWAANRGRVRKEPELSPIQVASAVAGSAFGAPVTLTERAGFGKPVVAVDPSGVVAVAWGAAGAPAKVAWRPAGSDEFQAALTPTNAWVGSVAASFGRPNDLMLALGVDLAPTFIVQSTSVEFSGTEPATPVAALPDTTRPVLLVKGVAVVKAPRKKGRRQPARLVATLGASEDVTVRAVVSQARKGIKRGGACVKRPADPKKRKGRKACTRTVVIGPEVGAPVGAKGAALDLGAAPPKGAYTLTVKGLDAAGNPGDPVAFAFTVR